MKENPALSRNILQVGGQAVLWRVSLISAPEVKINEEKGAAKKIQAWWRGTLVPDTAACSPEHLDSELVETDDGQAAAEEAEGSPDRLCNREGGGQAPAFGSYVAHPLAILPCSMPSMSSNTTGSTTTARPVLSSGATV